MVDFWNLYNKYAGSAFGSIGGWPTVPQPKNYDANGYLIGGGTSQAQKDAVANAIRIAQQNSLAQQMNDRIAQDRNAGINARIAADQAALNRRRAAKKAATKKPTGYGSMSTNLPGITYGGLGINAPSRSSFRKQAAETVAFQLNPQLNALTAQANQTNQDWAFGDTQLRTKAAQAKSDLNYLLAALNTKLGSLKQSTDVSMTEGMSAVDKNYSDLLQRMSAINSSTNNATAEEINRMGLTTNQDVQATQRSQEDDQFLKGLAENNRANAATLLQAQKSSYDSAANDTIAAENVNFANQQATVSNTYAQAESELLKERNKTLAQINSNKQAVEAQRGFLTQQRIDSLYSEAISTAERRAQQDWTNQMAANNFNLNVTKFNYDTQYRQAQLARDKARLELDQAKATASNQAKTDKLPPIDRGLGAITAAGGNSQLSAVAADIFSRVMVRGDLRGVQLTKPNKSQILNEIRSGSSGITILNDLPTDQERAMVLNYLSYGLDAYWGN